MRTIINKALDWSVVKCSKCGHRVNRVNAIMIEGSPYGFVCAMRVVAIKEKEGVCQNEGYWLFTRNFTGRRSGKV
jgi:hypothetical protein